MPNHSSARSQRRIGISALAVLIAVVLILMSLTACEPRKKGSSSGGCVFTRPKVISIIGIAASVGIVRVSELERPQELPMPRPKPPKPSKAKERKKNCDKASSPVWNSFKPYKNGVRTNGEKGKDARFYEWDHTHNDIEEYGPKSSSYKHLGSLDPSTGKRYKEAVPGRNLKDKLK